MIVGPISCLATSARNYHSTLSKIAKERRCFNLSLLNRLIHSNAESAKVRKQEQLMFLSFYSLFAVLVVTKSLIVFYEILVVNNITF